MNTNPYQILQVSPDVTPQELYLAFQRLASQHHPSRGGDPQRFAQISNAYQTLHDQISQQSAQHHSGHQNSSSDQLLLPPKVKGVKETKKRLRDTKTTFYVAAVTAGLLAPGTVWLTATNGFLPLGALVVLVTLAAATLFSKQLYVALFLHRTQKIVFVAAISLVLWSLWFPLLVTLGAAVFIHLQLRGFLSQR